MADSPKPEGPYTLWLNYYTEGWRFKDFPTLGEALEAERHQSDWHISKPAVYAISEVSDGD